MTALAQGAGEALHERRSSSRARSRACISNCASSTTGIDKQEQFDLLRSLRFFHDFSHSEIWEVLRASEWCDYQQGDEIVREGEMDDRFYIIVTGYVHAWKRGTARSACSVGRRLLRRDSYVRGARRTATIRADDGRCSCCA